LWREIVASVLDLPLETTAVEEGAAYGAALLAGCRSATFSDVHDAVARCVHVRARTDPNPQWSSAYAEGHDRFRRLYTAHRQVM
jgi:xylulokinase